jgi:pimeloyl-ACP methyl ester carboxylesterase
LIDDARHRADLTRDQTSHGTRVEDFRISTMPAMTPSAAKIKLASNVALSYIEQGAVSGPTVVLLPGPTDSWHSYVPALEYFPRSIRAVAVSQRGHGDSGKPATGYRVEDFAADVVPLLDALDIERAVVAGHSGSCLVTRRVALDHPERVAGLVLEASPSTLRGHAGLAALLGSVLATLEDPVDPAFARSFVADTSSDRLAPELLEQLAREVSKVPARVWKEMFAALLDYDDLSEIARIAAPTLLMWGDADTLVSRDMQSMLMERIRGAELVVYREVGHTPRWEDPMRFADDIARFVEPTWQSWR